MVRPRRQRGDRQAPSCPSPMSPTGTSSCSAPATSGSYLMEEPRQLTLRRSTGGTRGSSPPTRASPHRLAARALVRAGPARRARRYPPPTAASRARPQPGSHPPRRGTCGAPTSSRTWPTSWSAASRPRARRRLAFEELICSTAASAASRPARSSSTHAPPRPPGGRSSAPSVHGILAGWRKSLQAEQSVAAERNRSGDDPGERPLGAPDRADERRLGVRDHRGCGGAAVSALCSCAAVTAVATELLWTRSRPPGRASPCGASRYSFLVPGESCGPASGTLRVDSCETWSPRAWGPRPDTTGRSHPLVELASRCGPRGALRAVGLGSWLLDSVTRGGATRRVRPRCAARPRRR